MDDIAYQIAGIVKLNEVILKLMEYKQRLLIRADDLGYSEGTNYGIAKTVNQGIVRSVGLMTNMSAAEHGLNLFDLEAICLGLHTNICAGRPLCDPVLIPSLVDAGGMFKSSQEYHQSNIDFVVSNEAVLEIEAQLQRFIVMVGRLPDYIEGHAVKSCNFFQALKLVAVKFQLKYIPLSLSEKPILVGEKKIYVHMNSMRIDYNPWKTLEMIVEHPHFDGCESMICHPGYLDEDILKYSSLTFPRPLEVSMLCDPKICKFIEAHRVELITYNDI